MKIQMNIICLSVKVIHKKLQKRTGNTEYANNTEDSSFSYFPCLVLYHQCLFIFSLIAHSDKYFDHKIYHAIYFDIINTSLHLISDRQVMLAYEKPL